MSDLAHIRGQSLPSYHGNTWTIRIPPLNQSGYDPLRCKGHAANLIPRGVDVWHPNS